ncbi:MAG: hypothetical protein ACEQSB_00735 [Undibacterium sp.]
MTITKQRLEFAAEGFLAQMRVEAFKKRRHDPAPVRMLAEYSPADRNALTGAIQRALDLASPAGDQLYFDWSQKRTDESLATP